MASSVSLVHIIGGGLAGCEAAWQVAECGLRAVLYEMRPCRKTPAHATGQLAELVCSNSLKTEQPDTAPWLLKQELRRLGSLELRLAEQVRVPGGHALVVDRERFAAAVTATLASHPRIEIRRQEVASLPEGVVVVASGPLTSDALAGEIARLTGCDALFFYDAISPIVEAASVDLRVAFRASRYGKSLDAGADYLNCPLDRAQYERFVDALLEARAAASHVPGDIPYFEACLPIEELARRGRDTLRFGPMKPAGLIDPRTGRRSYAVVQLRQEDLRAGSYNLVGFQNHLRFGDQQRLLRLIPGLEHAEFLRFGQVHRNTYLNGPALLNNCLQLRQRPEIFFAGQLCGVEGYVEAMATGWAAGRHAAALARGGTPRPLPRATALGSLCHYLSAADPRHFQPANMTFDLLPPLEEKAQRRLGRDRAARQAEVCRRALSELDQYVAGSPGVNCQ